MVRQALRHAPCSSTPRARSSARLPFCRRMMFIYGEAYDHDQLNDATHEHLHEAFGVANMTTFKPHHPHPARGPRRRRPTATTSTCRTTDNLRLPISFIHGENNRLFTAGGQPADLRLPLEAQRPRPLHAHGHPRLRAHGPVHRQGRRSRRLPRDHGRARPLQLDTATAGSTTWEHDDAPRRMEDLFCYPLMSALTERRTRRIARGVLGQRGAAQPREPQRPRAADAARGGHPRHLHHRDHRRHHARRPAEQGQRQRRARDAVPQRRSRAPAAAPTTARRRHFFMINDDGIFLLKHPDRRRGAEALHGPAAEVGGLDGGRLAALRRAVQGADLRQAARVSRASGPTTSAGTPRPPTSPGTTLFYPVVDCTWQYINALLIIANRARRQAAAVHRRLAPVPPEGPRRVDGQDRRRGPA